MQAKCWERIAVMFIFPYDMFATASVLNDPFAFPNASRGIFKIYRTPISRIKTAQKNLPFLAVSIY